MAACNCWEALVIDDGSTDATAEVARCAGARLLDGGGRGPGAARNLGWRASSSPLVWFVDSDCVPEPGSLARLIDRLAPDPGLAGVGGSYSNLEGGSWLATTIHEEILARHARMSQETDHLGSFNVLYRRAALERVGGFDERRYNGPGHAAAEDLELSMRLRAASFRLGFVPESRVGHHHPTSLVRYLRTQAIHGFYATRAYLDHPGQRGRSRYSGWLDHLQPPLAVLALTAAAAALGWRLARLAALGAVLALIAASLPMAARVMRRRLWAGTLFLLLSPLRSLARGFGLVRALIGSASGGIRE